MSPIAILPAWGRGRFRAEQGLAAYRSLPRLAHAIETARCSQLFARICVIADDARAVLLARRYGAEGLQVDPPAVEGGDGTLFLAEIRSLLGLGPEESQVCVIRPQAVCVSPQSLERGFRVLRASAAAQVVAVTTAPHVGGEPRVCDERGWLERAGEAPRGRLGGRVFFASDAFSWCDLSHPALATTGPSEWPAVPVLVAASEVCEAETALAEDASVISGVG